MERAVVIRGTLRDPKHIELDEPLTDIKGEVEVVIRQASPTSTGPKQYEGLRAWEEAFDQWIDAHDRSVPIPSEESLRREAMYEDRL